MSVSQSVARIRRERVTLEMKNIDRLYLNVYIPKLQCVGGVVGFFRELRGATFASSALMEPLTTAFVKALERFAQAQGVPLLTFAPGQRKDAVAREYLAAFHGQEGVLFIGKAQEKVNGMAHRTAAQRADGTALRLAGQVHGAGQTVLHLRRRRELWLLSLTFCAYVPYNAKPCLNGRTYIKRQLVKEGIAFEALDNGILSCADSAQLHEICDGLGASAITGLLPMWLPRAPHPFTPQEREAGFRYNVSILQAEFALIQVLDRPLTGRILCEEIIRENLDVGRPDQVQLIVGRHVTKQTTAGYRFRTRVIRRRGDSS